MKSIQTPREFELDPTKTAADLLLDALAENPNRPVYALIQPDGSWKDVNLATFFKGVQALAKGFIAGGVEPGDLVAICSRTRYEWPVIDFAMWLAGAKLVGIYETSSVEQIRWILSDSAARIAVVENSQLADKFRQAARQTYELDELWVIDDGDLDALADRGRVLNDEELSVRSKNLRAKDVATVIYTSGTFGKPKGCVLTHSNIYVTAQTTRAGLAPYLTEEESAVFFLPPAHSFARIINLIAICSGIKVAFEPDPDRLLEDLKSFRPTLLVGVPRVFEKLYKAIFERARNQGREKLFRAADRVAVSVAYGKPTLDLRLKHAVFNRLIYRKIRASLGKRVRLAVSGSAPLNPKLGLFFKGIGIEVLEGYGLTESSGPLTLSLPGKQKIGSVGAPLPGVTISLATDGEILARGPGIFYGYLHDEEHSQQALAEGWLHTGDLGKIEDQTLRVIGRKKEVVITSGGKNIPAAHLQTNLQAHPLIGYAIIAGDGRPFPCAIISLDESSLPHWLKEAGLDRNLSFSQAIKQPKIIAAIEEAVTTTNATTSHAEAIKKWIITPEPFTHNNGLLTPKFSVRRQEVLDRFRYLIEELYD